MKEQIYVVRQRVAEGGGMEATVGSAVLPKASFGGLCYSHPASLQSYLLASHTASENGPEKHCKVVDPAHLPPQIK